MSKQTESSLFIFSPLAVKHAGLYQQLLREKLGFEQLGNRILREIKDAHAFRQVEAVRELARILINIPIKEYHLVGQYYLALCGCREKRWHTDLLEKVVDQSQTYKTRALMSLAAIEGYKQNYKAELFYFNEALKTSPNLSDFIEISKAIAVIKAKESFHRQSLKDCERLLPVLRYARPFAYFDFLNSYAVELAEAGRLQEAENITGMVMQSPLVSYYPEWQETRSEINQRLYKSSSVAVSYPVKARKKKRATARPRPARPAETSGTPDAEQSPARVLSFPHIEPERIGGVLVPQREEVDAMIRVAEERGAPALLAVLLKMVLKDRITRSEIQLICDVFYHD